MSLDVGLTPLSFATGTPVPNRALQMEYPCRCESGHAEEIEAILKDPQFSHVYFDISWDEVAKYLTASPEAVKISADLINRYPNRFLFGTDEVAPADQQHYLRVFEQYKSLWNALTPEAREKVQRANYTRLFDQARSKVRAWEAAHP